MKPGKTIIFTLTLLASCSLITPSQAGKKSGQGKQAQQSSQTLTAVDATHLTFMREEEKLARDVYRSLSDFWNTPIFSNIAGSEQRHMDALLRQLSKYDLPDPAKDEGEFGNQKLQALYDQLTITGSVSLVDALRVGALIEEVDIKDLNEAIASTKKTDLTRVYTNLLNASHNHLRAFAGQIEAISGTPYKAQHLSQKEVDSML